MGFFSKKEVVPELPVAPRLPDLPAPYEKKDLPELPSFPLNQNNESFNREMIKSAVSDVPSVMEMEERFDASRNIEVQETIPRLPRRSMEEKDFPKRRVLELNADIENKPVVNQIEPIYVRIDRFQSSKRNFEKIKEKVTEVEKVLRKIKDVKEREEKELDEWSLEIEKLKSRLSEIDSDIFSQL